MSAIAPANLPGVARPLSNSSSNAARLSSTAQQFESLLLGQWLKNAESSFGSVPGSEEEDAGGEQMKDFAMQHVADELTKAGGIGIAAIVAKALAKQETPQSAQSQGEGAISSPVL